MRSFRCMECVNQILTGAHTLAHYIILSLLRKESLWWVNCLKPGNTLFEALFRVSVCVRAFFLSFVMNTSKVSQSTSMNVIQIIAGGIHEMLPIAWNAREMFIYLIYPSTYGVAPYKFAPHSIWHFTCIFSSKSCDDILPKIYELQFSISRFGLWQSSRTKFSEKYSNGKVHDRVYHRGSV